MHALYWRIFLAFWAALALILVGTLTVAVNATKHRTERPWIQRGQLYSQAAAAFQQQGPAALRQWLHGLPPDARTRTFVLNPDGTEMLGRPLPASLYGPGHAAAVPSARGVGVIAPVGGALVLMTPQAGSYHVIVGPVRDSPRLFGELELPGVPLAILLIALAVSAAVCYVLARYLAAPVDRLRLATRRLASGDLNVRVLPALRRRDDLGLLAADLELMAERLRQLLEAKQQLLRDVSHELRSPLTRLQLALSLARREGAASDRHLVRASLEADRLEQLLARTLRLVRLEQPFAAIERNSIDLADLLRTIVADVAIEADAQGCDVLLDVPAALPVCGDAELLRSVFENVIRNAVRHSPAGTQVRIEGRLLGPEGQALQIVIRDRGPGVPEKDLGLIFEPFYRVEAAREHRGIGGEGLGLAIAARAVVLHEGSISAANAPDGGLLVSISLPANGPAPVVQLPASVAAA
jgi:two-component system sensor histidine kinase CpxA